MQQVGSALLPIEATATTAAGGRGLGTLFRMPPWRRFLAARVLRVVTPHSKRGILPRKQSKGLVGW